jgi:hypothetical protein
LGKAGSELLDEAAIDTSHVAVAQALDQLEFQQLLTSHL